MLANRDEIVRSLAAVVGDEWVVADAAGLSVYQYDASDEVIAGIHRPLLAVLPSTAQQVAASVAIANAHGLPVVARGAGTGLAGGAIASSGGLLIVLTRMTRILEVNTIDRYAVVEPGLVNLDLSIALADDGYFFAPDPASQRACTIGGNIANNSGGPHCLKYGVTSNHILGLEVVLPSGELTWVGGAASETSGYDLTGAIVGSEGTLGIVTKAMVRLTRKPEAVSILLAAFPTMESASRAVTSVIAHGILPASLEMMDALTISAVEAAYHCGYPTDAAAVLLVELDGMAETVAENREDVARLCRENDAQMVRVATSKAEQDLLWLGRKSAFGTLGRLAPNYYLQDTVVPRTKLPTALKFVELLGRDFRLQIANVFHAGDGNLHPLMLFDRYERGAIQRVLEAGDALLEHCIAAGGSVSGEHGIGLEKKESMTLVYTPDDLAAMAGLKLSFDPYERFNPGKIFPTAYSCGELSRLKTMSLARETQHVG
ncbi:MAG TPA: FAD-linked oxidase C-terminal domain-containing protein [Thermomicrobiales bacterium]|nr:FAD-linked oxidase C-terminal domain-containing protein [Thermomicrobiales bacterium]